MVTFVPTPIGNIEDITLRALRALEHAQLILCEDTRQSKKLFRLLHERHGMQLREVEFVSFHEHNQHERLKAYGERIAQESVVFVSDAGMPAISDPGQALVAFCQQNNVAYDVLPGASAPVTAYVASGFEGGKFLFYGFLPPKKTAKLEALKDLVALPYDVVFFESPRRLLETLHMIAKLKPQKELFVAKELTKQYQRYIRSSAEALSETLSKEVIRGEWVVVIKGDHERNKHQERIEEILASDLPPKQKAKALSKHSEKNTSWWYRYLLSQKVTK